MPTYDVRLEVLTYYQLNGVEADDEDEALEHAYENYSSEDIDNEEFRDSWVTLTSEEDA